MKVLILSVADKRHMPMIAPYMDYLEAHHIPYDIIRPNRYDDIEKVKSSKLTNGGTEYSFRWKQSTSVKKIYKVLPYIRFREFAISVIKKRKYDFIIVWNENTALLFSDLLNKKYKKKFCINIRDEYPDKFRTDWLDKVIHVSAFATTPSPMVYSYTNQDKIIRVYNQDTILKKVCKPKQSFAPPGEPIRITFLGTYYRAKETFQRMVNTFANDDRFVLQFFGDGFDTVLQQYANDIQAKNVVTGGAFPYEQTSSYLENTDIINSYYNTGNINLKYAAGIKESYTPMLYIPAIVDKDTYWGDISKKYGFSFLVNPDEEGSLPDELYNWYRSLNYEEFVAGCNEFNKLIENSKSLLERTLDSYV